MNIFLRMPKYLSSPTEKKRINKFKNSINESNFLCLIFIKNTKKKSKFPVFYYHSFSNKIKPRTFLIANKQKQKTKRV